MPRRGLLISYTRGSARERVFHLHSWRRGTGNGKRARVRGDFIARGAARRQRRLEQVVFESRKGQPYGFRTRDVYMCVGDLRRLLELDGTMRILFRVL